MSVDIKDYNEFKIKKTEKIPIPEQQVYFTLTLPIITTIDYKGDKQINIKNKVFKYTKKEKNKDTILFNDSGVFTSKTDKYKDIILYDIKNQKFYNIKGSENDINIKDILQKSERTSQVQYSNITRVTSVTRVTRDTDEYYLKHKGGEKYIIINIYVGLVILIHNDILIVLDNIGQKSNSSVDYNRFSEIYLENIKIPQEEFDDLFNIVFNNAISESSINYFE
jgi:hypothetical protein